MTKGCTTMLSREQLKRLLHYDPDTGIWMWLDSPRPGWAWRYAGWVDHYGYLRVKIGRRVYICARLAFLYMTGSMPEEVDHIDRDPRNDRWNNLRAADRSGNNQNRAKRPDNKSGAIGVFWNKQRRKWTAQVGRVYLGLFDSIEEATLVRDRYARDWHGPFAQLNIV
jgi:hypothetical protein